MKYWILTVIALTAVACGGNQLQGLDAFRQARALTAEMGAVEDRAEALTRGMTEALLSGDSPDAQLDSLERYVNEHANEMHEVAEAIAVKFNALPEQERGAYHEAMADRFSEPVFFWRDTYFSFAEDHPDRVERLETTVAPAGEQLAPHLD